MGETDEWHCKSPIPEAMLAIIRAKHGRSRCYLVLKPECFYECIVEEIYTEPVKEISMNGMDKAMLVGGIKELFREHWDCTYRRRTYLWKTLVEEMVKETKLCLTDEIIVTRGLFDQLCRLFIEVGWPIKSLRCIRGELDGVLPDSVYELSSLESLSLQNLGITALPEPAGSVWPNLRCLMLHGNRLERLPAFIGGLMDLEELYIGHNNIDTIHSVDWAAMNRLGFLHIGGNRGIMSLPDALLDWAKTDPHQIWVDYRLKDFFLELQIRWIPYYGSDGEKLLRKNVGCVM